MTPTKSNLAYFVAGAIVAFLVTIKLLPKPEPKIEYVEKIVEVEKKKSHTKRKLDLFPDGTMSFSEEEVVESLASLNKDTALQVTPVERKHQVNLIGNTKVTGGLYIYHAGPLNAGVILNNGGYLTGGVSF